MLKRYNVRDDSARPVPPAEKIERAPVVGCSALIVADSSTDGGDGLAVRHPVQSARLPNSEMVKELPTKLDHLDDTQKADIVNLVAEFPCLFGDVPTRTTVLQHDIDVSGPRPIKQHPYRVNQIKRELMKTETEYLMDHNLARPSSSAWSSPCLLETKADGSPRFITDYRKVNAVTVPDSYPLPRMEDCVDNLGSAKFVSKLDLLKGYWQVPLTDRASTISAFVTPDRFLQYTVMAFGMCNAPATFQRLVNIVLAGVSNCNAYLDDVIIYSSTWTEHLDTLSEVFRRLAAASLTLNLAKCEFGKGTVTYLGRQVGQGEVPSY